MTVSEIEPKMSRTRAIAIIAILVVVMLVAILIPDNGGAIKSISYYDEGDDATYTFSGDKDGYIDLDGITLRIEGRDTLVEEDDDGNDVETY